MAQGDTFGGNFASHLITKESHPIRVSEERMDFSRPGDMYKICTVHEYC